MTIPTEYFRWCLASETQPGRRIRTRFHMTREQALARDPTATPVPGTRELRHLPENEAEMRRLHAHSINTGDHRADGVAGAAGAGRAGRLATEIAGRMSKAPTP